MATGGLKNGTISSASCKISAPRPLGALLEAFGAEKKLYRALLEALGAGRGADVQTNWGVRRQGAAPGLRDYRVP